MGARENGRSHRDLPPFLPLLSLCIFQVVRRRREGGWASGWQLNREPRPLTIKIKMSYTRRKGEKRNFSFGFTGLNLVPLYSRVSCPALPPSRCILMQYIFSFLLRILFLLVLLVRPSARPVIFSSALQPPRPVPPSSSYSLSLGFASFLLALERRTKHQPIPDDRFKPQSWNTLDSSAQKSCRWDCLSISGETKRLCWKMERQKKKILIDSASARTRHGLSGREQRKNDG